MKTLFLFDIKSYFGRWGFYAMIGLIIALSILAGANARFSLSDDIFSNAPYQISYIMGMLSLTTIFFSTIFASQLLFKEQDARFQLLIFSAPVKKSQFIAGRFLALLTISFTGFTVLVISFFIGQSMAQVSEKATAFNGLSYLFPFVLFGFVNTLLTTAVLSFTGWVSKSKLLVYVAGLLLYIGYMVALIFSNSPLMAQNLPQSEQAQLISAITDPFGISAFFYQTADWPVAQRNTQLTSLNGVFLFNRLGVVFIAIGLVLAGATKFPFLHTSTKSGSTTETATIALLKPYTPVATLHHMRAHWKALISFTKMDLIFTLKSAAFVLAALALLFYTGMEIYGEIEKGIRLPQKYATSGLMVETIVQNFHIIGVIVVLYYAHEIFWRSKNSNFYLIENTTANIKVAFFSKWLSLSTIVLIFSMLLIVEGIVFQLAYQYPVIEWHVYAYVLLLNTLPLILLSGCILFIQQRINQKLIGLSITAIFALILTTQLGRKIIAYPLFKFLHTLNMDYSDMNGFGAYIPMFVLRLLFGTLTLTILVLVFNTSKKDLLKWPVITALLCLTSANLFISSRLMNGYAPISENTRLQAQVNYEKLYRKLQDLPQPTITTIQTTVALHPKTNSYSISGTYTLENKSDTGIHTILINFADGFTIHAAQLIHGSEIIPVQQLHKVVNLQHALLPRQKAVFKFEISYSWKAVNGHQSFNSIVENGSFMRISRYYPTFGYESGNEIENKGVRKQFQLGDATLLKPFNAPKSPANDFINLDMTLSVDTGQTAIGVGELTKQWVYQNRNYFQYKTTAPIPFRFAVSAAKYAIKREMYKGKTFEIYYHPTHSENVAHLLYNAKLTMDYCEANFGKYPFSTVRFAEISGFTKGFAATAYPASIFMTEDMLFHANIAAGKQQDVINELAGHELSHLWWGNSQIDPDDRAGAAMLTETLAMYTEMVLLGKMHGAAYVLKSAKMHLGIYNNQRGFTDEQPLYQVLPENAALSYSKGAVVMYLLSRKIGTDKINLALKNFLAKNKYPHPKPISTDFINELYLVCDKKFHPEIDRLFKEITPIKEEELDSVR